MDVELRLVVGSAPRRPRDNGSGVVSMNGAGFFSSRAASASDSTSERSPSDVA